MNKKCTSLVFDEIKNKKVASSVLGEKKDKNKNLLASSVFQKTETNIRLQIRPKKIPDMEETIVCLIHSELLKR